VKRGYHTCKSDLPPILACWRDCAGVILSLQSQSLQPKKNLVLCRKLVRMALAVAVVGLHGGDRTTKFLADANLWEKIHNFLPGGENGQRSRPHYHWTAARTYSFKGKATDSVTYVVLM
jgi:hypothetical protein